MKALCWHGKEDVSVDTVPDPKLIQDRDAVIRVTATAICGSDLHIYDNYMKTMKDGDILGHEFMGVVEEVGPSAKHKLKVGDRVVVPFTISCGECFSCANLPASRAKVLESAKDELRILYDRPTKSQQTKPSTPKKHTKEAHCQETARAKI